MEVKRRETRGPIPAMAGAVVSRRAIESLRRGHPWIYRSAVVHLFSPELATRPAIIGIFDEERRQLGSGVWDPASPIAIRAWSLDPGESVDARSFRARLADAIGLRNDLFVGEETTAYRLLNGEGDRAPAFVVDRYGDVAVLRIDGDAARAIADDLLDANVTKLLEGIGITSLLERTGRRGEAPVVRPRFGPMRERVEVREHGVPFLVDLARGQKTGAFLDQRENRRRVGELVARRARARGSAQRVLNLFSYTGGFSLRAALAGAAVTSVDVAAAAHATAQESFRLAGVDPRAHAFAAADCFAWLDAAKKRGETFDVVISDPPSFAPSESAKPKGLAAYRTLHRACAGVLATRGTLVAASCSSHVTSEDFSGTLDDATLGRPDMRLVELHGLPPDHPTLAAFPEGRYLKLAVLESAR